MGKVIEIKSEKQLCYYRNREFYIRRINTFGDVFVRWMSCIASVKWSDNAPRRLIIFSNEFEKTKRYIFAKKRMVSLKKEQYADLKKLKTEYVKAVAETKKKYEEWIEHDKAVIKEEHDKIPFDRITPDYPFTIELIDVTDYNSANKHKTK